MKKNILSCCILFAFLAIVSACKKENTDNNNNNNNNYNSIPKATLTMSVNGSTFSTNNADAIYFNAAGSKYGFSFGGRSSDSLVSITAGFLDSFDLNRNYQISRSSIADVAYYNSINSTRLNAFIAGGTHSHTNARLNYRVIKNHNLSEYMVRCDVDFDGVLYKGANDSVVITNGRIRY